MHKFFPVIAALALSACASALRPPETAAGPGFLTRNATQKGVKTLDGGVQYFVLASGPKGGRSPTPADTVSLDYEGKLTTGETFDSSFARGEPLTGRAGAFVPGFTTALVAMKPGDDWLIWIPPEQAYGDRALPGIPPGSVLRFRLKLHSVTPAM